MAKVYLEVQQPFTRRIGASLHVGHPKHRDIRGRFMEVDDGPQLVDLISSGKVKKITRAAYQKATEAGDLVFAGDVRVQQTAGQRPNVSITDSNEKLAIEAKERGVDISKAKNRGEIVKLINGTDTSVAPEGEGIGDYPTDVAAGNTNDSTNHDPSIGVQTGTNDVGTTNQREPALAGYTGAEESVEDDADKAPTGGDNNS